MNLLPKRNETIVSPFNAEKVMQSLSHVTSPPTRDKNELTTSTIFVGTIAHDTFRISLKVNVPENFNPIIYGSVDQTSLGSILHVRFRLFFSSQLFLSFWTAISILASALFIFLFNESLYAVLALSIGLLNYSVSLINFNRKTEVSYRQLLHVLKMDK